MLDAPSFTQIQRESQPSTWPHRSPMVRRLIKSAFDYIIVIPALISLAPLMMIIAVLIKLESSGPVLHRRQVLGRKGREFNVYTFRTVYIDGDERLLHNRDQWVALLRGRQNVHDPRVTRVGIFLRRFGLDQLPSLLNILARHMSLVGPYIMTKKDMLRIDRSRIEAITAELPGLTGLWQVSAQNAPEDERASLELNYISNWSLSLDVHILLATFTAVRRVKRS